jgi:hypothetical protein
MKQLLIFALSLPLIVLTSYSCKKEESSAVNIIYLHHSTGEDIWGTKKTLFTRAARRISDQIADKFGTRALIPTLFKEYNKKFSKNYAIKKMAFPKSRPYGWANDPFNYYDIWVKNAGEIPYKKEPTLEILTKKYQVIIFKHCFPVSNISPDRDTADINSYYRSLSNYKLQYEALKDKMQRFPLTKFILFTGPVQVKANLSEEEAIRAKEFYRWVRNEWDLSDDNIYLWDLYSLETEGGLYFKDEYAVSPNDSHPNNEFARKAGTLLFNRIIDVIENDGRVTLPTGEKN